MCMHSYLYICVGLHFHDCINVWTMLASLSMCTNIGEYACRAMYVGICMHECMHLLTHECSNEIDD
jgi:hypothetical protein